MFMPGQLLIDFAETKPLYGGSSPTTPVKAPCKFSPSKGATQPKEDTMKKIVMLALAAIAGCATVKPEQEVVYLQCQVLIEEEECGPATTTTPSPIKDPLFYGGIVGAGVGLAAVATGGVLQTMARAGYDDITGNAPDGDTGDRIRGVLGMQTGAVVTAGVGAALLAAGGASALASTMME